MYAIYGNIWGILMVNVTIYIYDIHGSYGYISMVLWLLHVISPVSKWNDPPRSGSHQHASTVMLYRS